MKVSAVLVRGVVSPLGAPLLEVTAALVIGVISPLKLG
jgi:hypothetical protein